MAKKKQIETIDDLNLMRPDEIKEYLDQYVIGQDEAKKTLAVAVYNHYKRIIYNHANKSKNQVNIEKSKVLIGGASGSGKTYMLTKIAELLGVPSYVCTTCSLTQAGFVGADVEDCLVGLLRACDYNIEAAQLGIVIFDEIDKIAKKDAGASITRDVSGEGVQQSLLRIVESTVAGCPPAGGRKHPEQQLIYVDTTNILFIGIGAFVGLEDIVKKRMGNNKIGFNIEKTNPIDESSYMKYVTPQDFKDFGFIPEFIGRFPVITYTEKLDKIALMSILKEPKNSLIKQYTELLMMDGMVLKYDDDALDEIVNLAYTLNTGARGLRSIMETVMRDVMFDAPKVKIETKKSVYTVTKDMVTERTKGKFKNPTVIILCRFFYLHLSLIFYF